MSVTVSRPAKTICDRRAGWSGPSRWQREVQLAAELGEPKCAFRTRSLERLSQDVQCTMAVLIREIAIPMLHQRYRCFEPGGGAARSLPSELADQVADLLLHGASHNALESLLHEVRAFGVSRDTLLRDVLCEVEAHLERCAYQGECTALDATAHICQLRTLALTLSRNERSAPTAHAPRACTLTIPGDSLRFTPVLHECHMRAAGWSVEKLDGLPIAQVHSRLRNHDAPDAVVCVLNEARLLSVATELVARLRDGREPGAAPLFIGVGRGYTGCERWPCQVSLDAVSTEPTETLQLVRGEGCCERP